MHYSSLDDCIGDSGVGGMLIYFFRSDYALMTHRNPPRTFTHYCATLRGSTVYLHPLMNIYTGGSLHNGGASLGSFSGTSLFPCTLSALTKTGITPPVSSANPYKLLISTLSLPLRGRLTRCLMTSRIDPIAPEWDVNERSMLGSEENMSSRSVARRYRRADLKGAKAVSGHIKLGWCVDRLTGARDSQLPREDQGLRSRARKLGVGMSF